MLPPKTPQKPPIAPKGAAPKFNPIEAAAKVAVLRGKKPPKAGGGVPPGGMPPQGY